jgi:hypothetical protein
LVLVWQPVIGIESLESWGLLCLDFIKDICHRIIETTREKVINFLNTSCKQLPWLFRETTAVSVLETVVLDEVYYF